MPERLAETDLPAAVRMLPAVTLPVLMPAGRPIVNCRLATLALPGLKVIGKLTLVPAAPETEPAAMVGAAEVGGGTGVGAGGGGGTGAGGGGGGGRVAVTVNEPLVLAPAAIALPLASEYTTPEIGRLKVAAAVLAAIES